MLARKTARKKTRFAGVYTREIVNRQNHQDTAFDIAYRHGGKLRWRCVGLASQGQSAAAASRLRGLVLADIATGGDGSRPLAEAGLAVPAPAPTAPGAPVTFADAWRIWWDRIAKNLAQNGQAEESRFRLWLNPAIGSRPLADVATIDLEKLKTDLLANGLSPSTVVKALGDVRRVYAKMRAWDLFTGKSPLDGLVFPRVDNARTRFLTREEAALLLEDLSRRSPTWHAVAWLSLHTGMRKGEILALRGTSVDFTGGQLLVRDAKTGSRSLPLTEAVAAFLRPLMPARPGDLFFATAAGTPISHNEDRPFRAAVARLGLNNGIDDTRHKVVFHTLRHTFCSWLAMAGVPLHTIGQLAGHKTAQMTARYAHLAPDHGRAAAALVGDMLAGATHR